MTRFLTEKMYHHLASQTKVPTRDRVMCLCPLKREIHVRASQDNSLSLLSAHVSHCLGRALACCRETSSSAHLDRERSKQHHTSWKPQFDLPSPKALHHCFARQARTRVSCVQSNRTLRKRIPGSCLGFPCFSR